MSLFRLFWHTVKIFIIFMICTLFFYFGLIWINQEYENYNRYNQPEGNAIKVSSTDETDVSNWSIIDRIKLFLQLSE